MIPKRPLTRAHCSLRLQKSRGTRRASFTIRPSTLSMPVSCPCGMRPRFTSWSPRLCLRSRSSRSRSRTSTGRGSSARTTFHTMGSTARPRLRCSRQTHTHTHTHTHACAHATVRTSSRKPPLFCTVERMVRACRRLRGPPRVGRKGRGVRRFLGHLRGRFETHAFQPVPFAPQRHHRRLSRHRRHLRLWHRHGTPIGRAGCREQRQPCGTGL